MMSSPDILAPYLIHFENTKPNAVESLKIYDECMSDVQSNYAERLDHSQQKYEEVEYSPIYKSRVCIRDFSYIVIIFQVCREENRLQKFMNIVHDRLSAEEYEYYLQKW